MLEIAKALSAMAPVKVIWKLAEQDLQVVGLSNRTLQHGSNVKVVEWAPQNDLLGHPNVRAFFTQGGMNSFNEVGINIFGHCKTCLKWYECIQSLMAYTHLDCWAALHSNWLLIESMT